MAEAPNYFMIMKAEMHQNASKALWTKYVPLGLTVQIIDNDGENAEVLDPEKLKWVRWNKWKGWQRLCRQHSQGPEFTQAGWARLLETIHSLGLAIDLFTIEWKLTITGPPQLRPW